MMTRREALDWLASIEGLGIKLGLDNSARLLAALGDPQRAFRSILVGGTNGKGSVAAMIESILAAAGHRTGIYTSPHLTRFEERIGVGGRPVSGEEFSAALGRVREAAVTLVSSRGATAHPTHFEVLTAAAFLIMADRGVELAVLEVGMGGRLDATVLAVPLLSVLTNVSLEHTRFLGSDIASIAREKAGILPEGGRLLAGERHPDALAAFRERAAAVRGRLVELDEWAGLEGTADERPGVSRADAIGVAASEGSRGSGSGDAAHAGAVGDPAGASARAAQGGLTITTGHRRHEGLTLGLRGNHQRRNALLAVAAVDLLDMMGIAVPAEAVRPGLASARWPGRFQDLGGSPRLILDGAHNPAACRVLRETMVSEGLEPEATTLLLGILRDKELGPMLDELLPVAGRIVTTRGLSGRFRDPWALSESVRARGIHVEATDGLDEGLRRAREITPAGGTICATGSLYLVGDLMSHLGIDPFAASGSMENRDRGSSGANR